MDLRLIEYFVAVVDHGSITRAAQALYLAQPSLSQAIRTLERQLEVQLFDRSRGTLSLTLAGEQFVTYARQILDDVAAARHRVHQVRDLRAGRLDIAAHATLALDPLPELAARLHSDHPEVLLNVLDPGSANSVVEQVRHGQAEVGLVELPVPTAALQVHELCDQEIVLALPPQFGAVTDPVPRDMLGTIPLVVEASDAGARRQLDEIVAETGATVAVECAHRQGIWELVAHGAGAALLPRTIAETELIGVEIRTISPAIVRTVALVHRRGELSPAAQVLQEQAEIIRRQRTRVPSPRTPDQQATTRPDRRADRTPG